MVDSEKQGLLAPPFATAMDHLFFPDEPESAAAPSPPYQSVSYTQGHECP